MVGAIIYGAAKWLKEKCGSGYSWAKEKCDSGYSWAKEKIASGARACWCGAKNLYKKGTGQDVVEKAEQLLQNLNERVRKRKQRHREYVETHVAEINETLRVLNSIRCKLNEQSFPRFCALAKNFRNWSVARVKQEAKVFARAANIEVRSRSALLKIDFANHPIKANALAIVTLGFATRKKAKESLLQVQEEECRIDLEFEKLDAEETRIGALSKSLKQVERQFKSMDKVYDGILDEVDYSVALLKSSRDIAAGEASSGVFDVEFLPDRHLLALKSADEATRILFALGAQKYVAHGKKGLEIVCTEVAAAEDGRKKIRVIGKRLAA